MSMSRQIHLVSLEQAGETNRSYFCTLCQMYVCSLPQLKPTGQTLLYYGKLWTSVRKEDELLLIATSVIKAEKKGQVL